MTRGSLRPCLGTTIASRRRATLRQPLLDDELLFAGLPASEAVCGEGGEVQGGNDADDPLREVLADGRTLLEAVPREARRIEEPARVGSLSDKRVVIGAHLVIAPPGRLDGQVGEER